MKNRLFPLLLLMALGAFSPSASARTIAWGSSIDSILVDSSGNQLDASYTFELGSFGSFVPDAANIEQWLVNWKVFDRATAPGINGFSPVDGYISSEVTHDFDFTTGNTDLPQNVFFNTGEQAYMFAYNSLDLQSGVEWALITNDSSDGNIADDWLFPVPETHSADTLDWRINLGATPIIGGENDVQGPGTYSSTPQAFTLQTSGAVPEPGSALLVGVVGLIAQLRRRRH